MHRQMIFKKIYIIKFFFHAPVEAVDFFKAMLLDRGVRRQFIIYVLIGGISATIDFSVLFTFTSILGVYYIYSTIVAYPCGAATHFLLNKYFNFKRHEKRLINQVMTYVMVNFVGLCITLTIMYILVEYFGLLYLYAKAIAVFLVLFYSFNMHRAFTFR